MKKLTRLLTVLSLIAGAGSASAVPLTVNGLEWLQPIDFINLSWIDISATCNPTTGACNGLLGTTDVTGYTWASVEDINSLFNYYINDPFDFLGPGPDYTVSYFTTAWASAFFADGWLATGGSSVEGYSMLQALVRDTESEGGVTMARKALISNDYDPYASDLVSTDQVVPVDNRAASLGGWLFRNPEIQLPVPVPATSLLLCIGLAALGYTRRKRN